MTTQSKAIAAASVAVLSWSTVASAFKISLRYFTNYEMVTVAACVAAMIFGITVTVQRKWNSVRNITPKGWLSIMLLGLINPTSYYLMMFAAYDRLPAQVAQPVNYTWPIFLVLLMALVMRRPVKPRLFIGMAISLAGVAVIAQGSGLSTGGLSVLGIVYALGSALIWAFYWILDEKLVTDLDESVKLFLSFLFGATYLIVGTAFVPCNFSSVPGLWASVYVGAFEMGIPFLFFSYALRTTTNVALVNQMCYIAPFMSLFIISIVVGETIALTSFLGLVLIIGGVLFNRYLAYPSRQVAAKPN
jgi:hypothetical protein